MSHTDAIDWIEERVKVEDGIKVLSIRMRDYLGADTPTAMKIAAVMACSRAYADAIAIDTCVLPLGPLRIPKEIREAMKALGEPYRLNLDPFTLHTWLYYSVVSQA